MFSVGLAGLSLIVYAGVWSFEYVGVDDPIYVVDNSHLSEGLTPAAVAWAFSTSDAANWHPLTWLSLLLDVEMFGLDAGKQHAVNLLLHIANVLLLFWVLVRATGAMGRSAFVAALFAVHPLHVESVAWVSERKDVLSTLFWLLTMAAYAAWVQRPVLRRYLLVVAMLTAGLLAKPMLVTLPFVLLLWDLWPLHRFARAVLLEKAPLLALACISCIVTLLVQRSGGAVRSLEALPLGLRIENALVSYLRYLGKLVWPGDMTMYYPTPASWPVWLVAASAVVIVVVSGLVVRAASRRPHLSVGWFWYLGTLVPVIGLVQVGHQAIADRYTYVPSIGVFILAAWGITDLASRSKVASRLLPIAACIVLVPYAVSARAQVQHWRSDLALWTHALQVRLDLDEGRARLAAEDLKADNTLSAFVALLEPRQPDGSNGFSPAQSRHFLGRVFARHQQIDEAALCFREAVQLDPALAQAQYDLGVLLMRSGKSSEALPHLTEAARLEPRSAEVHAALGAALAGVGRKDEAVIQFQEVLRLKPDDAMARQALDALARGK
jgi:hypothetical protein